ncbi:hypothetical protein [Streptomyces inusitatus]|nr:hypothetical protein [Streptomyces inusitatus]
MDPMQLDGHVRRGPVDTLSVADASRQLDAVTRYVAQAREDLDRLEGSRVVWKRAAKEALAQYGKDDPAGVDQVLDSINLLSSNPAQSEA